MRDSKRLSRAKNVILSEKIHGSVKSTAKKQIIQVNIENNSIEQFLEVHLVMILFVY